jgi:2-methylisocitrate lyase-like PEP mutase family enzyme
VNAPRDLALRCERLRSLHVPGSPLVLPNAWDVASARAVAGAGFPAVATTSGGVAATLGYEDHEGAPGSEMLAAAARIAGAVDLPVTVDAEAGYGLAPAELVEALADLGAAGCNLEDTDHSRGELADAGRHADWLRAVRQAADERDYPVVVNARVDVFLAHLRDGEQGRHLGEALARAHAYFESGVDCVYPIALWEREALAEFVAEAGGPVNALASSRAPDPRELAELGVARISYGSLLHRETFAGLRRALEAIAGQSP